MKFNNREAVDVYFKAKTAFKFGARTLRPGEPFMIFDSIKTSTTTVASEMTYVTGGRSNRRIMSYEGDSAI